MTRRSSRDDIVTYVRSRYVSNKENKWIKCTTSPPDTIDGEDEMKRIRELAKQDGMSQRDYDKLSLDNARKEGIDIQQSRELLSPSPITANVWTAAIMQKQSFVERCWHIGNESMVMNLPLPNTATIDYENLTITFKNGLTVPASALTTDCAVSATNDRALKAASDQLVIQQWILDKILNTVTYYLSMTGNTGGLIPFFGNSADSAIEIIVDTLVFMQEEVSLAIELEQFRLGEAQTHATDLASAAQKRADANTRQVKDKTTACIEEAIANVDKELQRLDDKIDQRVEAASQKLRLEAASSMLTRLRTEYALVRQSAWTAMTQGVVPGWGVVDELLDKYVAMAGAMEAVQSAEVLTEGFSAAQALMDLSTQAFGDLRSLLRGRFGVDLGESTNTRPKLVEDASGNSSFALAPTTCTNVTVVADASCTAEDVECGIVSALLPNTTKADAMCQKAMPRSDLLEETTQRILNAYEEIVIAFIEHELEATFAPELCQASYGNRSAPGLINSTSPELDWVARQEACSMIDDSYPSDQYHGSLNIKGYGWPRYQCQQCVFGQSPIPSIDGSKTEGCSNFPNFGEAVSRNRGILFAAHPVPIVQSPNLPKSTWGPPMMQVSAQLAERCEEHNKDIRLFGTGWTNLDIPTVNCSTKPGTSYPPWCNAQGCSIPTCLYWDDSQLVGTSPAQAFPRNSFAMKNYETAYEWDRIEPSVVTGLDVLPAIPPVNITFKTFKSSAGKSWSNVSDTCADDGQQLCSYSQVCPLGTGSPPNGGKQSSPGQIPLWTPVTRPNGMQDWVRVGSSGPTCISLLDIGFKDLDEYIKTTDKDWDPNSISYYACCPVPEPALGMSLRRHILESTAPTTTSPASTYQGFTVTLTYYDDQFQRTSTRPFAVMQRIQEELGSERSQWLLGAHSDAGSPAPPPATCDAGFLPLSQTKRCSYGGYTCVKAAGDGGPDGQDGDGPLCCDGRHAELRACVPCAETLLAKPEDTETTRYSYTTPGTCIVAHRASKEAFFLDNRTEVTGLRTLDETDKKITPCEVSSSNPQCVTEAMAFKNINASLDIDASPAGPRFKELIKDKWAKPQNGESSYRLIFAELYRQLWARTQRLQVSYVDLESSTGPVNLIDETCALVRSTVTSEGANETKYFLAPVSSRAMDLCCLNAAGNQGKITRVVETGQLLRYECDRVHLG